MVVWVWKPDGMLRNRWYGLSRCMWKFSICPWFRRCFLPEIFAWGQPFVVLPLSVPSRSCCPPVKWLSGSSSSPCSPAKKKMSDPSRPWVLGSEIVYQSDMISILLMILLVDIMIPDHSVIRASMVYWWTISIISSQRFSMVISHGFHLVYHDPHHVVKVFCLLAREVEFVSSSHEPMSFGLTKGPVCV